MYSYIQLSKVRPMLIIDSPGMIKILKSRESPMFDPWEDMWEVLYQYTSV